MKKFISFITLGMLLATFATFGIKVKAETVGDTDVTAEVTAGDLTLTASKTLNFDSLTYTGNTLNTNSSNNATVTVFDARGNFEGWGVTVKQTQGPGQTWGSGMALKLVDTVNNANTVSISTTDSNAFSQAASSTNYDVKQETTYSGSLVIPSSIPTGTYATTLVWTLGATPTT